MDDDRQIEAELQRNFQLLACSLQKLLNQNYTRYNGISGTIKSCIYKALVHSVSERQSNV